MQENLRSLQCAEQQPNDYVRIVGRDDIPSIHEVVEGAKVHHLGLLKDFHKNPYLKEFVPDNARLSMSWVRLLPGEVLTVHQHPIRSMIVICSGSGSLQGDLQAPFSEGDIIVVPPGRRHGLTGTAPTGFWGISVQFEQRGLYEDPTNPLVHFEAGPIDYLKKLEERNAPFLKAYVESDVFTLIREEVPQDPALRQRFLGWFQQWSNYFQRMVLLRTAMCDDPKFSGVFLEHLHEEFGHNTDLQAEHGLTQHHWDPQLDAMSCWFVHKMLTLDNVGKAALVHLVIEHSAAGFYSLAGPSLSVGEGDHWNLHAVHDPHHEQMGVDLLRGINEAEFKRLCHLQEEGWSMLIAVFSRMSMLARRA